MRCYEWVMFAYWDFLYGSFFEKVSEHAFVVKKKFSFTAAKLLSVFDFGKLVLLP